MKDSLSLDNPLSEEKIKKVVWNCNDNKNLGLDGFTFNFLQSCWEIVKMNVVYFVKDFHSNARLTKSIITFFLSLISKNLNLQALNNYQPICFMSCFQKILAKVLTSRLKRVLGIISYVEKIAFVLGKSIFDGALVVNEVLDMARRLKKNCMVMKIDFERAYDCVN